MNKNENNTILLNVRDVHKTYRMKASSLHVLKGIDLQIKEGEIISIVGPSGVGKSTLLHIIGILDRPDKGTVEIDDIDVFSFEDEKCAGLRNKTVGFVFQAHYLLPEFTALENIMMPGMIADREKNELKESAQSLLTKVGLEDRADHRPRELSGGEQQRIAVARALINRPRLLLADEPTGNLDLQAAESLHDLLWQLNREENQTLIIVTHNRNLASQADRIIELFDGRVENIRVTNQA